MRLGDVIAASVRAERARRRWTQAELAARLGWGKSTIADMETGRRSVFADDLPALCAVFEIPLAELVRAAEPALRDPLGL